METDIHAKNDNKIINQIFNTFLNKESLSGIFLFISTIAAIIVANSPFSELYFKIAHSEITFSFGSLSASMDVIHWINDGLMALFFLLIGLEVKRELIYGELSSVQKATIPVVAGAGGMIFPAIIYSLLNPSGEAVNGYGIPMATDIAFVLGILMLLGKRVPLSLKVFLVSAAVVDDIGAVMIIAIFYTENLNIMFLGLAAVVMVILGIMNMLNIKILLPYFLAGLALWIFIHDAGVHATVAGILLAIAIPIKSKIDDDGFINRAKESIYQFEKHRDENDLLTHHQHAALENIAKSYDNVQSPLVKLEHYLHPVSAFFIMPLFAFFNAGVELNFAGLEDDIFIITGIMLGLIIGKPIGVAGVIALLSKLKVLKMPEGMSYGLLLSGGMLAGVGFTMSIFISNLAFVNESIIEASKMAILGASLISAILGTIMLILNTKVKK